MGRLLLRWRGAVGWVEWIAIHQGNGKALRIADKLAERREEYPILDDDLFSDMEDQECAETWRECYSPNERLEYLRTAYRNGGLHQYGWREILAAVRGDWCAAANILPCPSDLIS